MAETGMTRRSGAWSGWVSFAAVLLTVLGVLNILEGLVALIRRQVAFIDGDSLVVVDVAGLGVVMVVFGALLTLAGIGLFARNPVARVAAIVIVALHALAQIGSLGAYPVWSLLMIALDVIVIYALTVHWAPLEPALPPPPTGGVHRADRDQQAAAFPMNPPRPGAHAADSAPEMPERAAPSADYADYQGQRRSENQGSGESGAPNAGPYPPGRGTNSPAHSSAPTSGHGTGAI
ncbi:DUF7144 family membrane protein [Dactylosporangium sp. CA-139066]|uniref:DUF7144 family membrane protein n=1 Tax=Dactylosporangium sp. CA-139066 TaxID=3239930 RepID=UPI003D938A32